MLDYHALPEEVKEKAKACKSADELVELAHAEGIELTDEELGAISGGNEYDWKGDCTSYVPCTDHVCCSGSVNSTNIKSNKTKGPVGLM